jgi:hypothetical protein
MKMAPRARIGHLVGMKATTVTFTESGFQIRAISSDPGMSPSLKVRINQVTKSQAPAPTLAGTFKLASELINYTPKIVHNI